MFESASAASASSTSTASASASASACESASASSSAQLAPPSLASPLATVTYKDTHAVWVDAATQLGAKLTEFADANFKNMLSLCGAPTPAASLCIQLPGISVSARVPPGLQIDQLLDALFPKSPSITMTFKKEQAYGDVGTFISWNLSYDAAAPVAHSDTQKTPSF